MQMGGIEEEFRAQKLRSRWTRLDRLFAAIGDETASLIIILLALAMLCAPVGLGLGVAWLVADWVGRATAPLLGWIAGIAVFAFFCRYVWGSRLQKASRRAAEALVAKPDR